MEMNPRDSLFLRKKLSSVPETVNGVPRVTHLSREGALKIGKVSVLSLAGVESKMEEYMNDGRVCWEFEPLPNFEKIVNEIAKGNINSFEVGVNGRQKILNYLEKTAEQIALETGETMNLWMLTPSQAIRLIEETIKSRMNYEYLVLSDAAVYAKNGEIKKTSRPELLKLLQNNSKRFYDQSQELIDEIDSLTADKLLDFGFGVCRHFTAMACAMYEVLKEEQLGILLNGSYLVYNSETKNDEGRRSVVGEHGYNILVVSSPNKEVSLSVLDMTRAIENIDLDYTWRRISQVCYFLTNFGEYFGIEDSNKIGKDLALEGCRRLVRYFDANRLPLFPTKYRKGVVEFLDDYVCLINQTEIGETGGALAHLVELFETFSSDNVEAVMQVLALPSYVKENGDEVRLRSGRAKEINLELRKIDFDEQAEFNLSYMYDVIESTIRYYSLDAFDSLVKDLNIPLSESTLSCMELIGHFMRICVGQGRVPKLEFSREVIDIAIRLAKRRGLRGDLIDFEQRYRNL